MQDRPEGEGNAAIKHSQTSYQLPTHLEHVLPENLLVLLSELLVDHLDFPDKYEILNMSVMDHGADGDGGI